MKQFGIFVAKFEIDFLSLAEHHSEPGFAEDW